MGRKARKSGDLNLIFTTNSEIRRINKRHLNHDYPTDVIAFPCPPNPIPSARRDRSAGLGEIYVSVDQARKQAGELGHSHLEELLVLAIHGTLHLMGYDDHAPAKRRKMFARQAAILKRLGRKFSGRAGLDKN